MRIESKNKILVHKIFLQKYQRSDQETIFVEYFELILRINNRFRQYFLDNLSVWNNFFTNKLINDINSWNWSESRLKALSKGIADNLRILAGFTCIGEGFIETIHKETLFLCRFRTSTHTPFIIRAWSYISVRILTNTSFLVLSYFDGRSKGQKGDENNTESQEDTWHF